MIRKSLICYTDLMLDKIYIDRLKSGGTEDIDQILPSHFLDVDEDELSFCGDVKVHGKAYLSGDHLTLQLDATAKALMPCRVCNETTEVEIALKNCCMPVALEEIKGAVFDPNELVREVILAEVPARAECKGNCPLRDELKPFLKEEVKVYFPFKDIEET